ncbi:MAG: hypothetical protein K9N55_16630 [Phycisphaerae bacterium]|nr:hypothetical protein [Phycisphaerae bacterium]
MYKKNVLLWTAMILVTSVAWGAQDIPAFTKGDHTFTLGGGGNSDKKFDNTVLSFNLGLSEFITNETAVAVRQELNFADVSSDQTFSGSTRFALDYHFNAGKCRPFVGANIGYLYGDNVKEQFIAGPEVGVKQFLNPSTFIYVNAEYQVLFKDTDQANNSLDDGRFVYSIGMGIRW